MSSHVIDETCVDLSQSSDYALAVSAARSLAGKMGFNETDGFLIASAVSELAANIIRYAGQGLIRLRRIKRLEGEGFEVIAQDSGPGIASLEDAMKDNFSTGRGLGLGLPSVRRIMNEFEIKSELGRGTMVIARKWRT
ncbi:MAG: ATP-binding protein [Pseudomonadota bacterium]